MGNILTRRYIRSLRKREYFCVCVKIPKEKMYRNSITMVQCTDENCRKPAVYGTDYNKKPIYCGVHREEKMVNLKCRRCKHDVCKTRPGFNYPGENIPLYCKPHRLTGMESVVKKKTCLECSKSATFNLRGKTIGLYCGQHKKDKMFNTRMSLCLDCDNYARYGTEDKKPIHCKDHSTENEYQVTSRLCVHENCKMGASFSISGRPTHCGDHKTEQMYNTNCKSCAHPSCKELPLYNDSYGMTPLFCVSHKTHSMVMVHGKRCASPGCFENPYYNYDGLPKLFCTEHKEDGMTNVTGTRCAHADCTRHPSFNYFGLPAKFCGEHKLEKMENVHSKKCHHDNCNERALYNYEGLPTLYCHRHKHPYMTDVNAKQCVDPDCSEPASFNYPDKKGGIYCSLHALDGMKSHCNLLCTHPLCLVTASQNFSGETRPIFCASHKTIGMRDIITRQCKIETCDALIGGSMKYRGYCRSCFVDLFPDDEVSFNYKVKEIAMANFIKERIPGIEWICDRRIPGGMSLKRGDVMGDLSTHLIIIECDESKHSGYSGEIERMHQLFEDAGNRPILFIRFNPDSYLVNKRRINSCWGKDDTGITQIVRPEEWTERLERLVDQIESELLVVPDKPITIRKMFYDTGLDEYMLCQPCE